MPTLFTRIINGEIPCHKIAEDENYFAFLDISPLAKGHTLVVPKTELDYIFDIEDAALAGMMLFAKKVARAIDKAVPCTRVGVAVIGLEVPHAHIHLIPLHTDAINFSQRKLKLTPEELAKIAEDIRVQV